MEMREILGFSDPVSSWTHLLGAAVFAALGFPLLRRGRGNGLRVAGLAIFAAASVVLLSVSGAYHVLSEGGTGRQVMQRIDHAAIFVMIASTFTPVHGILFRGFLQWGFLAVFWSLAIAALTLKTIFFADIPSWLDMGSYLTLGWAGIVSILILWKRHGFRFAAPLLWGGLSYTLGTLPLGLDRPVLIPGLVGPHEIFHVGVLAGLAFHWHFIFQFAAGPPERRPKATGGERDRAQPGNAA